MSHSVFREPLLHFALIGALLFAVSAFFSSDDPRQDEIVVTQSRIDHLAAVFERRWQRPPTEQELNRLVDNFVREEVLYREALKLGLDRDDTVIRRRLRMKMEFLAKDLIDAIEPEDRVLRDYFAVNAERYLEPAQLTIQQIYFNRDTHKNLDATIETARALLWEGAPENELGDSSLLQRRYEAESSDRLDRLFGEGFAEQLQRLPQGEWSGPVESAYGLHLVLLESVKTQRTAQFDDVRAAVLRDWQTDEQKKILEAQYDTYRNAYELRVEGKLKQTSEEMALQ
ncbi:peptidylprolyl isomerase [Microbulbifer aggregans]|uniref:peptidylprolyl isomerase n=1 Tax=Microbulbifer aggregans TaxID=1769779 RepID=A0A1C9W798_9GAMM|nr:peptidylprolyl isomerase [Microbulbifer aggregans]AOS97024.1 peptidylprolyl isomerase [Microbulbifer aggregans]